MSADLLAAIVASTQRTVAARAARSGAPELERLCAARSPRGAEFRSALTTGADVRVIAECKRRSPSRGVLRTDYDASALGRAYQAAGAAAISVLTEPAFFDGSLSHLAEVRDAVSIPVLRKDFIVDRYQLLEAVVHGADAVLLIVAALDQRRLEALVREAADLGLAALVEVHDADELERADRAGARLIGVNNRDLRTLQVSVSTSKELAGRLPAGAVAVAESGLRDPAVVADLARNGYHAFLVGEHFMASADPGAALASLIAASKAHLASGESRAVPGGRS